MLDKKNKNIMFIRATVLLIVALICTNLIANLTFELSGYNVLLSVFLYPFVFFFANVITKYYGWQKTLVAILAATGAQSLFYIIINVLGNTDVTSTIILGSLCGFVISQITNLALYTSLTKQKNVGYFYLVGIYFIALLLDNLTYFAIIGEMYDFGLVYATIFRTAVAIALVYFDYKFYKSPRKLIK